MPVPIVITVHNRELTLGCKIADELLSTVAVKVVKVMQSTVALSMDFYTWYASLNFVEIGSQHIIL